jgi:hypothetical protein
VEEKILVLLISGAENRGPKAVVERNTEPTANAPVEIYLADNHNIVCLDLSLEDAKALGQALLDAANWTPTIPGIPDL